MSSVRPYDELEKGMLVGGGHGRYGLLPTNKNIRIVNEQIKKDCTNFDNLPTSLKIASVAGMISLTAGLIAIGSSTSNDSPCEALCIIGATVSGISGLVSSVLCCVGWANV